MPVLSALNESLQCAQSIEKNLNFSYTADARKRALSIRLGELFLSCHAYQNKL